MIRLAVIFESSPFDRKGLFNAVHHRIKHLLGLGECEIDAYCIHSKDTAFTRKIRHTPQVPDTDAVVVDDVRYRLLWYPFSIIDHLTVNKLHLKPFFFSGFVAKVSAMLEGYDFILAHSFTGGIVASEASQRYGIPYSITWHGSDIHTHPWRNPLILKETRKLIRETSFNFFVSRALLAESDKITPEGRKDVLYNGVSDTFRTYPEPLRKQNRERYGLEAEEKVVAFAGSIVAVKNVVALHPIFHKIRQDWSGRLKFWMIGDGKLRSSVEPQMQKDPSVDVRFWGNMTPEDMPSLMNCVDVLLLPSLNEGLPLVCAEAIRCGAEVFGSDVGGIAEVIGKDHSVPLGDDFVENIAAKVVEALNSPQRQTVPAEMDWKATAEKEMQSIMEILKSE